MGITYLDDKSSKITYLDSASGKPEEPTSLLDQVVELGKNAVAGLGGAIGSSTGLGLVGELAGRAVAANPQAVINQAPTAGMVAGGLVGGVPGAAVGGAAGEAFRQVDTAAIGGKKESSSLDALAKIGAEGLKGAAAEIGGKLAAPVIAKGIDYASVGGKSAAKGFGKVAQFFSGVPKSDIVRIAADPAAILPEIMGGSKSIGKAGKGFGAAVEKAGFVPAAESAGEGLAKFKGAASPFKSSDSVANTAFERIAKGEELTAPELYDAYQSAQESVSKMSRWNPRKVKMLEFKNALQEKLQSLSGEYAAASQDFARAKLGESATNILPRTKTGEVSLGRTGFANLVLPGLGTVISSPALYGGTTAATAGTAKVAAKILSNPVGRRITFSEIIRQAKKRRQ